MSRFKTSFFADSQEDYQESSLAILGVPYDGTTSFRPGTRRGPAAIREFSYNFESYIPHLGTDLQDIPFFDMGDLEPASLPETVVRQVEDAVRGIAADSKIPILLGGEHTITAGSTRALLPDVFIVCDAHLDLRDEFLGTPYSHACTNRRVYEDVTREVYIIGARSGTPEQYEFAKNIHLFSAEDVILRGIGDIIDTISAAVGGKRAYLSIDADVIDCCITPGVGTPEPFGLTVRDIRTVIDAFAPFTVGFDYVEVAPFDAGQTAAVAAALVKEYIAVRGKDRHQV